MDHQQSGSDRHGPHVAEPVTNVLLHQFFAVSVLRISTAAIKTGRKHKEGEPHGQASKEVEFRRAFEAVLPPLLE
jgi:hypothetical protein